MSFLDKLKSRTRWNNIPDSRGEYRLLCKHETCSLSCANLRDGRISVTSVHGAERHSYLFTKNDMAFATVAFLNNLSEDELANFCNIFNKVSPDFVLKSEKL